MWIPLGSVFVLLASTSSSKGEIKDQSKFDWSSTSHSDAHDPADLHTFVSGQPKRRIAESGTAITQGISLRYEQGSPREKDASDMLFKNLFSHHQVNPASKPHGKPVKPVSMPPLSERPTSKPTSVPPTPVPTSPPTSKPVSPFPSGAPSAFPTNCLDGATREEFLTNQLLAVFETPVSGTPQALALDWIVNDDQLLMVDPCGFPTLSQRYGFAVLFFATNGSQWTNSSGWLGDEIECEWFGASCDNDGSSLVTALNLRNNSLMGSLPTEISGLSGVTFLDFSDNEMMGTLPNGIGNLTSLRDLDLSFNKFTGTVFFPEFISLTDLKVIRVAFNNFMDIVPTQVGAMTSLVELSLGANAIFGSLPSEMADLTSLEILSIFDSKGQMPSPLNGQIPSIAGENLTVVELFNNALSGTIPESLYLSGSLESLRLDNNFLSGPALLPSVGSSVSLTDLRLNENSLTGTIPAEIGNATGLAFLDLSNNTSIRGMIPEALFEIPMLQFLYLSNNSLTGEIPQNYESVTGLVELFLEGNFISGTIPNVSAGNLLNLTELIVYGNFLTGSVPPSVCSLRNLSLTELWADCLGETPEVVCNCCTACFKTTIRTT